MSLLTALATLLSKTSLRGSELSNLDPLQMGFFLLHTFLYRLFMGYN
jgi:hypothetical protein